MGSWNFNICARMYVANFDGKLWNICKYVEYVDTEKGYGEDLMIVEKGIIGAFEKIYFRDIFRENNFWVRNAKRGPKLYFYKYKSKVIDLKKWILQEEFLIRFLN